MKVKHNGTLLILGILTALSFVGYALFFILTVIAKGGNFGDFFLAMKDALSSDGFKRLFAPAGGNGFDIAYCIVNYLLILFIVIGCLYGIMLFVKTKHYSLLFGMIFCVLAIGPAWGFMLGAAPENAGSEYRAFLFDTLFQNKYQTYDANGGIIALTWFYLIFLIFAFCFAISFFVLTLIHARKNRFTYVETMKTKKIKNTNDENDEASILAELEEEPFPDEPERQQPTRPLPDPVEEDDYYEEEEEPDDEEEIVCSEKDFRNMLQDIIRDAVKAELDRRAVPEAPNPAQPSSPKPAPFPQPGGLNNGGPIIVQYFSTTQGDGNGMQPTNNPYPYGPYPGPYAPYPYAPYPYPYPQQPQPQAAPQQPQEEPKKEEQKANDEPVKEEVKNEEIVEENIVEQEEEKPLENSQEEQPQEEISEPQILEDQPSENEAENTVSEEPLSEELKPEEEPQIEEEQQKEEIEPVEEAEPTESEGEPVLVEEPVSPVAEEPKSEGEEDENSNKIIRVPFYERILTVDKELQDLYSELKNELLSYGLKSRVAANGDTFRLHRKTYCRVTVAGKSLKLYLALNPDDYKDSKMPYADAGNKATYAEIPFVFKVKSGLSLRRAKGLIADACSKDNLLQEDLLTTDWISELKKGSM